MTSGWKKSVNRDGSASQRRERFPYGEKRDAKEEELHSFGEGINCYGKESTISEELTFS
jgi:hypothetical protein